MDAINILHILPFIADPAPPQTFLWIVMMIMAVVVLIIFLAIAQIFNQWTQAFTAGVKVTPGEIIMMRLRKVDSRVILRAAIAAKQAQLDLTVEQLQIHYLAGGHVPEVVRAMTAAHLSKIEMPWNVACAMDLAGKDVPRAVETAIDARATKVTFTSVDLT